MKFILKDKVSPENWIFNSELGLVPLEVHIMKLVSHRAIIRFFDYFTDLKYTYLVTELHGTSWTWPNPQLSVTWNPGLRTPGQLLQMATKLMKETSNLLGHVKRTPCDLFECIEAHVELPICTIRRIFSQIVDAVIYLYSIGIVHRDIKDENIVVDAQYNIKIIDFGSASFIPVLTDDKSKEGYFEKFNGTMAFAAPEIIRGYRYKASEAEVWSLGVLLYTMVFKKSPFSNSESILNTQIQLPATDKEFLYDLINKMLAKDPKKRIRLLELKDHSFMTQTFK